MIETYETYLTRNPWLMPTPDWHQTRKLVYNRGFNIMTQLGNSITTRVTRADSIELFV